MHNFPTETERNEMGGPESRGLERQKTVNYEGEKNLERRLNSIT